MASAVLSDPGVVAGFWGIWLLKVVIAAGACQGRHRLKSGAAEVATVQFVSTFIGTALTEGVWGVRTFASLDGCGAGRQYLGQGSEQGEIRIVRFPCAQPYMTTFKGVG